MGTTEAIVDLDVVAMQAWKTKGIEATRREVEEQLIQARKQRIEQFRSQGRKAYAWGYLTRKTLLTPAGNLGPIRIPRIRLDGREIRLIPRQMRRIRPFEALTAGGDYRRHKPAQNVRLAVSRQWGEGATLTEV